MSDAHNARRLMHIQSHIAFGNKPRLAGMQPDADAYWHTCREGVVVERVLSGDCGFDRIESAGKDYEEGIPLGIHLAPIPLPKRGAQQAAARR
jgi:hypothetical protein